MNDIAVVAERAITILNDIRRRSGKPAILVGSYDLSIGESGFGLDSLDQATFSVALEQAFGTDPYTAGKFPRTLADVIAFYEEQ